MKNIQSLTLMMAVMVYAAPTTPSPEHWLNEIHRLAKALLHNEVRKLLNYMWLVCLFYNILTYTSHLVIEGAEFHSARSNTRERPNMYGMLETFSNCCDYCTHDICLTYVVSALCMGTCELLKMKLS